MKDSKGIYADKSASFQLFILLLAILFGGILSSMIGAACLLNVTDTSQYADWMRFIQSISATGTFLLPSLIVGWTCSKTPADYLFIKKIPHINLLALVLISMLLLSPFISLTTLLNKQMVFPDFLAPLENWMKTQETLAEQLTETLLSGNSLFTLLANLFVIALIAGITEEFLFRATLQRLIGRWFSNHHTVIWIAAFIFSAFHLQFYGFLPRLLLGAYFGYLLYWSKCIWIPVFAHFANNAFAVISLSDSHLKDNEFITGNISGEYLLPYSGAALVTLYLFYLCVKQIRLQLS